MSLRRVTLDDQNEPKGKDLGSGKAVTATKNKNGNIDIGRTKLSNGQSRFAKGNKGGPGRPKGSKKRLDEYHALLEEMCDLPWQRKFMASQMKHALQVPDGDCAKRLFTFFAGRPPQTVTIENDGGDDTPDDSFTKYD